MLVKTWDGKEDLPPLVSDEFITWMTDTASTGKMDRSSRPPLIRQRGDENVFADPDDEDEDDERLVTEDAREY